MSSIKFDHRTQSNSIDAIGSILFGRTIKRHTKIDNHSVSIESEGFQSLTRGASVRDIYIHFNYLKSVKSLIYCLGNSN